MKKRILVVDDDFSVRETLADILRTYDYEVVEASSGAEAIVNAQAGKYDCVIIDLRLPDTTGLEVIERISGNVPKNRIIVITGYASSDMLAETLERAEFFLLLKPVDTEQMLMVVKKIIEQ
ncbi:MAG: response regulator [Elusimicrobiota bacterium]|nr:response regulator [Elusimicrobiota bacterium]